MLSKFGVQPESKCYCYKKPSVKSPKDVLIQAEARALLTGVKCCLQHGFNFFVIECDSLILVQILKRMSRIPWHIFNEAQQLLKLDNHFIEVQHCFRDAN